MFPESEKLVASLYEKIAKTLDSKVSQLASDIGEQMNKKTNNTSSENFRYIYHNHMNLATKTTVHNPTLSVTAEVMQTIVDMHTDIVK